MVEKGSRRFISRFMVILLFTGHMSPAYSSFESKQHRYLMPFDLIALLNQKFGKALHHEEDCLRITEINKNLIGLDVPSLGKPYHSVPELSFVSWYGKCLISLIDKYFSRAVANHSWATLLGGEFAQDLGQLARDRPQVEDIPWTSLAPRQQLGIIKYWTNMLIGPPEVLMDLGYVRSAEDFYKIIDKSIIPEKRAKSTIEVTKFIVFLIAMRDEFITY